MRFSRPLCMQIGFTVLCLLCAALLLPNTLEAQQDQAVRSLPDPMKMPTPPRPQTMLDDTTPGLLRIGRVQIAWGEAEVPCPSPANVCQISVVFPKPFVTPPNVNFTNVADFNTQKFAFTAVFLDQLGSESFTARVSLQANIESLKRIPWMAIGYWR